MADKLFVPHTLSGDTLYFQVWDGTGNVYNGSSFEVYDPARWAYYDVALTEQGSSMIFVGTFPTLAAGTYSILAFQRVGASPAEGDPIIGSGDRGWTGTAFVDVSGIITHGDANWLTVTPATIAGAVLTNPSYPIVTNAGGQVEASTPTVAAIATAARAEMDSGSTQLAAIVADTNEVQTDLADGGRLDLLIDAILADSNEVQTDLKNGGRIDLLIDAIKAATDDLNDGQRIDLLIDAIKAVTDKADDTLEDDGGVYRFTQNALEQAPDTGDATAAAQTSILNAIAALNDPAAAAIATAVVGKAVDGTMTVAQTLRRILAVVAGKHACADPAADPAIVQYYRDDNTTPEVTMTHEKDGTGRTKA